MAGRRQCTGPSRSIRARRDIRMNAALQAIYGRGDSYYSDWIVIDQPMIDRFADATLDHQYIHIDPEKAAASPFGGTIAPGFLTLSLLSRLRELTPSICVP